MFLIRIDDIDFGITIQDEFVIGKTKEKISYYDYYKKQYNLEIKEKNQFLIKSHDKKTKKVTFNSIFSIFQEVFLISEYCFMTGFTDKMRGDFNLNKDIAETTKQNPQQRMNKLKELLNDF